MRIPRPIYEQMLEHAREEAPNECCGMIGGQRRRGEDALPGANAEASPLRYTSTPMTSSGSFREMAENGRGDLGDLPLAHREPGLSLADRHQPAPTYPGVDLPDRLAGRGREAAARLPHRRRRGQRGRPHRRVTRRRALRSPARAAHFAHPIERALLPQLRDAARLRRHPRGGADHRGARAGPQGAAAVRARRPASG